MKKMLALVLAIMLVVPSVAAIADQVGTVKEFNGFQYVVAEDNMAYITKYTGTDTEVVVPAEIDGLTVTAILDLAFLSCNKMQSVVLPDTLIMIGSQAFNGCFGLQTIEFPKSLRYIYPYAFVFCTGLKNLVIPGNVEGIGECAFDHCTSLTEATLEEGVKIIGLHAFGNCEALKHVTLPASANEIGNDIFYLCPNFEHATVVKDSPAHIYCEKNSIDVVYAQ